MVTDREFDAHRGATRTGMLLRGKRSRRLRQGGAGATVQKTRWLSVTFDRHAQLCAFTRDPDGLNTESCGEVS